MYIDADHVAFLPKPGPNDAMSGYLSFPKLLNLFQTTSLFFTACDQMVDQLEATITPFHQTSIGPIELKKIFPAVVLAPGAEDWVEQTVREALRSTSVPFVRERSSVDDFSEH